MNRILTAQAMIDRGQIPTITWDGETVEGPNFIQFGDWRFHLDRSRSHKPFVVFILRIHHSTNVAVYKIKSELQPVGRVAVTEKEFADLKNKARGLIILKAIEELCAA